MEKWTPEKSAELYAVRRWGEEYFDISPTGEVIVRPERNGQQLSLPALMKQLRGRGIDEPVLLRFDGILRDRIKRIQQAFDSAIQEEQYDGQYRCCFPIKVNQQGHVVEVLREAGKDYHLGLEVGSKPELIAVMAIHDDPDALLLCNGYKDHEYIELALMANKIGRRTVIIIERLTEVKTVLEVSERLGVDFELGIRMKPVNRGSGRWEASSGEQAKFGLSTPEIMAAVNELKRHQKEDKVKLLHFHIGSQITSIATIKRTLREATRLYAELYKHCPKLEFFDVGGGLAVDYDGSRTNFECSMNYTLEEYARDVVWAVKNTLSETNVPTPTLVSESGRALTAHHAVLVTRVIDVSPTIAVVNELATPPSDDPVFAELAHTHSNLSVKNCQEALNDALELREVVISRFVQGDLTLEERAYADQAHWQILAKIRELSKELNYLPEDLVVLDSRLKDTYFCNFSVFQSLPDSWAIGNLFPILPIDRHAEEPNRRAIIADISCDSDGKIEKFIDLKDVCKYVKLHSPQAEEPYYIAIFLVGAYQETLGDLHNLFGDTNAVHIDLDENDQVVMNHVVEGDTIREVLGYVEFNGNDLQEKLRVSVEKSVNCGKVDYKEAGLIQKKFKKALEKYTYLRV